MGVQKNKSVVNASIGGGSMEKSERRTQNRACRNPSVSGQLGFTYIELVIAMFLLMMIVPVIFFCFIQLVTEGQKIMDQERYQMNWLSCYIWMQRELKNGQHFRVDQEALLFEMPSGDLVRYHWDRGRIVRQVRKRKSKSFQGYTVLLQDVRAYRLFPYQSGVLMAFTFPNDYTVRTFIRGRIEE